MLRLTGLSTSTLRTLRILNTNTANTTAKLRLYTSTSSSASLRSTLSRSMINATLHSHKTIVPTASLLPSHLFSPCRALSTTKEGASTSGEEASSIIQQVQEGHHPSDNLPMTTGQKVVEGGKTAMWLGIFGLALACGGLVAWELRPTRFSPNTIFDKALDAIRENPEVTMRIGEVKKGYGTDHGKGRSSGTEGRRNFTAHDEFTDEDGNRIMRIKFNVQGTRGNGTVFAAVSSGVTGDLQYLIFQHHPPRGKSVSIALVDNRRQLTTEDQQMRLSQNIKKIGGVMYGSEDDPYSQRQKMELGDYFENIKYVDCSKEHGLGEFDKEYCKKLKGKFPTWKFGENVYPGQRTREVLDKICQFEVQHAAQNAAAQAAKK